MPQVPGTKSYGKPGMSCLRHPVVSKLWRVCPISLKVLSQVWCLCRQRTAGQSSPAHRDGFTTSPSTGHATTASYVAGATSNGNNRVDSAPITIRPATSNTTPVHPISGYAAASACLSVLRRRYRYLSRAMPELWCITEQEHAPENAAAIHACSNG